MVATAACLPLPDLPPGFELTVLREREDAFRHACNLAPQADAIGVAWLPEKPVEFGWPGTLLFDGARLGGGRLGWPPECSEEAVPNWLVFGAMLIASKHSTGDPGMTPESTSLEDEECELTHEALLEAFARNLMRGFHLWQ